MVKQILCHECAGKVRLNFPSKELVTIGNGKMAEPCGVCRKKRYCTQYELVDKRKEDAQ